MENHVCSMLCLSTVHIKPDTLQRLEDDDFEWLVSYKKASSAEPCESYGVFVLICDTDVRGGHDMSDIPEDLITVLLYAVSNGCDWVMFDRDEEEVAALPQYRKEWNAERFCLHNEEVNE